MNIEKQLDVFKNKETVNEARIEHIMSQIKSEPTQLPRKRKLNKILTLAASLILFSAMLIPINGRSFANSVFTWFQETVVETEMDSLQATDADWDGEVPIYLHQTFASEDALIDLMGSNAFLLPELPEGLFFKLANEMTFGEDTSTIYRLDYSIEHGKLGAEHEDPQMYIQIMIDYMDVEIDAPSLSTHIEADGLESRSINFLEEEAILTKMNETFTIHAMPIRRVLKDNRLKTVTCSLTYINMESVDVWEEGVKVLENIYLQYK